MTHEQALRATDAALGLHDEVVEAKARIAELEAEVEYHKHLALEALERLEELEEVAGDGDGDWYWRATGDYVGGTADKGE